jgi:hypothetical protein
MCGAAMNALKQRCTTQTLVKTQTQKTKEKKEKEKEKENGRSALGVRGCARRLPTLSM